MDSFTPSSTTPRFQSLQEIKQRGSEHAPERTLVLVRHAKSDWSQTAEDLHRPLNKRGRRQAHEAGTWLAAHIPVVDRAVISPARRARETWDILATRISMAHPDAVHFDDRVYDGDLDGVVRGLPSGATTVLLVGHNPDLEAFAHKLTRRTVTLKTSAIAVVDLHSDWAHIDRASTLRTVGRPPADPTRDGHT